MRVLYFICTWAVTFGLSGASAVAGALCDTDSEAKRGSNITVTGKITYIAPPATEVLTLSDGECEAQVVFPPFWSLDKSCRVGGSASVSAMIVKADPDDWSLNKLQALEISCR